MSDYTVALIGIGGWFKYTFPAIESIRAYNPNTKILVIDNGSERAYPARDDIWLFRIRRTSYAGAINFALRLCSMDDWLIVTNNDVICTGEIEPTLRKLDRRKLYGEMIHDGFGRKWLDGWLLTISRFVSFHVGFFDEAFDFAAYEDADYCWRAQELGYQIAYGNLPFTHLESRDRFKIGGGDGFRGKNLRYLRSKHHV